MWGCFLMSGVKILHFLKDWWKSIPIHQNYTMALMMFHSGPEGYYYSTNVYSVSALLVLSRRRTIMCYVNFSYNFDYQKSIWIEVDQNLSMMQFSTACSTPVWFHCAAICGDYRPSCIWSKLIHKTNLHKIQHAESSASPLQFLSKESNTLFILTAKGDLLLSKSGLSPLRTASMKIPEFFSIRTYSGLSPALCGVLNPLREVGYRWSKSSPEVD